MAFTFGAGTGDDITTTTNVSLGQTTTSALFYGWWKPTTLTATRKLWSMGSIFGAEVDTTTSELRLKTDNATTDGQWTTTGAALAVDKWSFLAFLVSCTNTGPAAAWRVWAGSCEGAPTECTITLATAPVSSFSGSNTLYIGNAGTGTLAFQGSIEHMGFIGGNAAIGNANVLTHAAFGTVTQAEADQIYRAYVYHLWQGRFPKDLTRVPTTCTHVHVPMNNVVFGSGAGTRWRTTDATARTLDNQHTGTTINGATNDGENGPRPFLLPMHHPVAGFML